MFAQLPEENTLGSEGESPTTENSIPTGATKLSSVQWESLGFSSDGKFFADITYGVEHDLTLSESHFFARLAVFSLYEEEEDKLIFERTLRRISPLRNKLIARSVMQDLLRRESSELRKFQIEALEQGEVLLFPKEIQITMKPEIADDELALQKEFPFSKDLENNGFSLIDITDDGQDYNTDDNTEFNVALQELAKVQQGQKMAINPMLQQDILDRVYTVTRNAKTTTFQLKQLRLDNSNSLRGKVVVIRSQGFPNHYNFQQDWNTLLQQNLRQDNKLSLHPVFITLSPDALHLLLTLRVYADNAEQQVESEQNITSYVTDQELEDDNSYAFVTFSVQVY